MASKIRKTDNATMYTCKRGWLISIDEEGGYLPFFLKVRNEDIVWDNEKENRMFKVILGKLQRIGYNYESEYIDPRLQLKVKSDGWIYHIDSDGSFNATYVGKIKPSNVILSRDSKGQIVSADFYVPLPISIVADSAAIIGNFEPIGTSIVQFTGGKRYTYTEATDYDAINIKILPSYDENVYAEHNSALIENFCNGMISRTVSLFVQGQINV